MNWLSRWSEMARTFLQRQKSTESKVPRDHRDQDGRQRISFHPSRGKSVRRSTDGSTVFKKSCVWKRAVNSLSFSNRSVAFDEIISISITNMAVIVGFVFQNPETLPMIKSSFDIIRRGNGFGVVLQKQKCVDVEFHYSRSGDVRFKVDGKEVAIFYGVVKPNAQPWVLIDMYNSLKNIQAMDADLMPARLAPCSSSGSERLCDLCCNGMANATLGKCGHDCCYSCAKKWTVKVQGERRTCPYCRQEVSSIIRNRMTTAGTKPHI